MVENSNTCARQPQPQPRPQPHTLRASLGITNSSMLDFDVLREDDGNGLAGAFEALDVQQVAHANEQPILAALPPPAYAANPVATPVNDDDTYPSPPYEYADDGIPQAMIDHARLPYSVKYYLVSCGRYTGILPSWALTHPAVNEYKGNQHESFPSTAKEAVWERWVTLCLSGTVRGPVSRHSLVGAVLPGSRPQPAEAPAVAYVPVPVHAHAPAPIHVHAPAPAPAPAPAQAPAHGNAPAHPMRAAAPADQQGPTAVLMSPAPDMHSRTAVRSTRSSAHAIATPTSFGGHAAAGLPPGVAIAPGPYPLSHAHIINTAPAPSGAFPSTAYFPPYGQQIVIAQPNLYSIAGYSHYPQASLVSYAPGTSNPYTIVPQAAHGGPASYMISGLPAPPQDAADPPATYDLASPVSTAPPTPSTSPTRSSRSRASSCGRSHRAAGSSYSPY